MTRSTTSLPSQDGALDLHRRLLAGDPLAPSDLATAYLEYLWERLIRRNARIEESYCVTAAEDAILALIRNPASYNPKRQSLEAYLRISADGDLKNILRAEQRHAKRRANLDAVEHSTTMGKYLGDDSGDPALIVDAQESVRERLAARLLMSDGVQNGLSGAEIGALELMQNGERRTERYAGVLGIAYLPPSDQRREVKRVKDRLSKRLSRAGGRR